jgi:poly-beta-hydroxyalkanoate depolymerase
MTPNKINLHAYVETLRSVMPNSIHPAAMATIEGWLTEMSHAADIGDTETAARLAWKIADKISFEVGAGRDA